MNIKIAWIDSKVASFDIDDENHVDEKLLKAVFPGIIGLEYELETNNVWKM